MTAMSMQLKKTGEVQADSERLQDTVGKNKRCHSTHPHTMAGWLIRVGSSCKLRCSCSYCARNTRRSVSACCVAATA